MNAHDLLDAYIAGEANEQERQEVLDCLQDDPNLQAELIRRCQLEQDLRILLTSSEAKPKKRRHRPPRKKRPNTSTLPVLLLAATLLLSTAAWLLWPNTAEPVLEGSRLVSGSIRYFEGATLQQNVRYTAESDVTIRTILQDQLNISAQSQWQEQAQHWMLHQGSVHCRIQPRNPSDLKFSIHTQNIACTVLGTEFIITENEQGTHIQLQHGRIALNTRSKDILEGPATFFVPHANIHLLDQAPRVGRQLPSHIELHSGQAVLAASWGHPEQESQTLLRYHPDTRIRLQYEASVGCHWIGLWWRNADNDATYHVPLGKAEPGTGWKTVEGRLGDCLPNGQPPLAQRQGDRIHAFSVQTGNVGKASARIRLLEVIPVTTK